MFGRLRLQPETNSAVRAANKAEQSLEYLRMLEERIDSLALASQALWEIVSEKNGVTQQQLLAKMEEVDLRDGRRDGKISKSVAQCSSCGRSINRRRQTCVYCGKRNESSELFGAQ